MKKQTAIALILLLLIPLVWTLGGSLFSKIHPEIAAGHPNYVRNYHRLDLARRMTIWASAGIVAILSLLICFLEIRSKKRSMWWLLLAVLGPFGFTGMAMLDDRAPAETDRYARFVRSLNPFVRVGYEVSIFVIIWMLAYQGMVLKRNLMITHESVTTGLSTAQILDQQNASSGMWAFAEGNEEMYMVVLLYLIRPVVFNVVSRVAATAAPIEAR